MHDVVAEVEPLHREVERLRAAAERAERRLRTIDVVTAVLASETAVAPAIPSVLAALAGALGCASAAYWSPAPDGLAVIARWPADAADRGLVAQRSRIDQGLAGRICASRAPVWIADLASDSSVVRRDALVAAGVRSGFGFPILRGDEVTGVIELYTRNHEPVDPALVDVLRTLGVRLGQFAQRADDDARARKQYVELELEHRALARINEVGRMVAGELDHRRLAQTVIDAATELTGAQFGALFYNVSDERVESYMLYAVAGVSREAFAKLPMPRNTAILSPGFLGPVQVRLADVTSDPRYGKNYPHKGIPDGHPPIRSYLATPVLARNGTALGGMFLGHAAAGVFAERAERIASELAAHAATALENTQVYDEAKRLITALEKTNAELDQFAYAASHDLRAPLRGITNLASWIDEDLPATTDATTKEHLRLLKVRAARMDRLINGLLELARIGRSRHKPERVDVTELLHDTIELANPREESRIMMIGEMPMLMTERAALQQVLLHLITNALQHAGREDVVVRISAIDRGDDWEIAIADNGVGIPTEHQARVWQLFQTLQSRDVTETTGIGLAIVRKQVEGNGGRAWIDPAAAAGATIRFTWPKRTK